LPGLTGLELQQHLLAQGSRMPVIFVTGMADPRGQTQKQASQLGAVAFLSKPFDELALLNAVRAAVAT
jgi:FixJ family two-component response regulator